MAESPIQRYALFAVVCAGYGATILWLVFRRRLSLQSSLLYLALMGGLGISVALAHYVPSIVSALGFALPSNLLFSVAIATLGLLHLVALLDVSRLEERSTTLVQEVALLKEQVERLEKMVTPPRP